MWIEKQQNGKGKKGMQWDWKSPPPNSTSRPLIKFTHQISSFQLNLEENYARNKHKKWGKPTKKLYFCGYEGVQWGWKIKTPKDTYNTPQNKFQLSSSIWKEDREWKVLFQGQKRENPSYLNSFLIDLGSWFFVTGLLLLFDLIISSNHARRLTILNYKKLNK